MQKKPLEEWVLTGRPDDVLIAAPGEPALNITAYTARVRVSGYVGEHISMLMGGDVPALVFSGGHLVWRVPVVLTSPRRGKIGIVGTVDVDAQTGKLFITHELKVELEANAQALVASPAPAPTA